MPLPSQLRNTPHLFTAFALVILTVIFLLPTTTLVAADSPKGKNSPAAAKGEKLSDQDAQTFLDAIFARQRKLTYGQADIVTIKKSGIFKREKKIYGHLKFAEPAYILFLERGKSAKPLPANKCLFRLLDGDYLWEMYPEYEGEEREATRRSFKSAKKNGQGVDIASYFVGMKVDSAAELYERFNVLVQKFPADSSPLAYLVTLTDKKKGDVYCLSFAARAAIPYKVVQKWTLVNSATGKKKEKKLTRELSNIQTNQTGLKPFPIDTFIFPLKPGIKVLQMPDNTEISPAKLKAELAKQREKFRARAAATKDKNPKQ